MKKQIRTVSDLYPSPWLYPEDLNGRQVTLTIVAVGVEEVHNPRTHTDEPRIIVDFGRSKRLICNKTQAFAIAEVAGTEALADWPGTAITLAPGRAPNGKATIDVSPPARAAAEGPTLPAPAEPAVTEDDDAGDSVLRFADGEPVPLAVYRSFLAYLDHAGAAPTPTEFWPWLHSGEGQEIVNAYTNSDAWREIGPDPGPDPDDFDGPDDIEAINRDLFGP